MSLLVLDSVIANMLFSRFKLVIYLSGFQYDFLNDRVKIEKTQMETLG